MMRLARDLRLVPVVAIAAAALFVLKTSGLIIEGGYALVSGNHAHAQDIGSTPAVPLETEPPRPVPTTSASQARSATDDAVLPRTDRIRVLMPDRLSDRHWAPELFGQGEVTGSVAAKPEGATEPPKDKTPVNPNAPHTVPQSAGPAPIDLNRTAVSAGERAVLESLQMRRQELEQRSRELDVRDSLLKAAEKRIEMRLQELKDMETRFNNSVQKREQDEAGKFKSLVTMYENMKPKDAAKIFDRLDMKILVDVVNQMNPRKMSDVLGQMSPEAAERLTVEIANRAGAGGKSVAPAELPKIEGRPSRS